jgi:hypothetical protein
MTFNDLYSTAQPLDPELAEEVSMFEITDQEAVLQGNPSEPDRTD